MLPIPTNNRLTRTRKSKLRPDEEVRGRHRAMENIFRGFEAGSGQTYLNSLMLSTHVGIRDGLAKATRFKSIWSEM